MRRLLAVLLTLTATVVVSTPVQAYTASDLRRTVAREMRMASSSSGVLVRDMGANRDLYAKLDRNTRIPASVQKLYTTSTALLRLGPGTTLDTAAVTGGVVRDGVLRGDLVLVGGGDPAFGPKTAATLARAVRDTGIRRITGAVVGDESVFDTRRSGCCRGYDSDLGGVLSGLAYDGSIFRGRAQLDAARFAATRFSALLRVAGVRSTERSRAGSAPAEANTIAVVSSPTVRTLIRDVNVPSNNFASEMLLKMLGARHGGGGSTSRGAAVVEKTLDDIAVRPRAADGSGLSRRNRTSPRDVVRLLERMDLPDVQGAFRASLANAGQTGTVRRRLRGTPAYGRCRLKTGTLRGVSSLAGYCRARGGRDIAFAVLMNRVSSVADAHAIQDRVAVAIARLDDPPIADGPDSEPEQESDSRAPTGGAGPS
ncbi:MAG: D-alanyl-D-alanine carboxypeptidase [Solirubrobacteraceae bacterium]